MNTVVSGELETSHNSLNIIIHTSYIPITTTATMAMIAPAAAIAAPPPPLALSLGAAPVMAMLFAPDTQLELLNDKSHSQ